MYFLYFVVMGAIAVAGTQAGKKVGRKIIVSAGLQSPATLRPISRVEQQANIRDIAMVDVAPTPLRPAVVMDKPDIHPGILAAKMDRVETAKPDPVEPRTLDPLRIAACEHPTCSPKVGGWSRSIKARVAHKHPSGPASKTKLAATGKKQTVAAIAVPQRKKVAAAAKTPAGNPAKLVRLAQTPGEIIRHSLLGRS